MTELEGWLWRWHAGWTTSRGWHDHEVVDGVLVTRVGERGTMPFDPGRIVEYMPLDIDNHPERLAHAAQAAEQDPYPPGASWVTIVTEQLDRALDALRQTRLRPGNPEAFMAIDLTAHPMNVAPPAPYQVTTTVNGDVIDVRVAYGEEDAARGRMGVVGADAVADMITTEEAHRRRGLGTVVMSSLARAAVELGARHGFLIASPEGRHLYRHLGWRTVADVRIAKTAQRAEPVAK